MSPMGRLEEWASCHSQVEESCLQARHPRPKYHKRLREFADGRVGDAIVESSRGEKRQDYACKASEAL
jgi:hypothetical protein